MKQSATFPAISEARAVAPGGVRSQTTRYQGYNERIEIGNRKSRTKKRKDFLLYRVSNGWLIFWSFRAMQCKLSAKFSILCCPLLLKNTDRQTLSTVVGVRLAVSRLIQTDGAANFQSRREMKIGVSRKIIK